MGKRKGRDAAADWKGSKIVFGNTGEQAEDARPAVTEAEPVNLSGAINGRHDLNCERTGLQE